MVNGTPRAFIIACLLATWLAAISPVAGQDSPRPETTVTSATLDNEKALQWLSLDPGTYPLLVTSLRINGSDVAALIDTGTRYSLIDRSMAERNEMQPRPSGQGIGISGDFDVLTANYRSLAIGGYQWRESTIHVADLGAIQKRTGRMIEAIIGLDFLSRIALEVDWDKDRVRLLPGAAPSPPESARVPLTLDNATRQISARVSINGLDVRQARLDTGTDQAVTVDQTMIARVPSRPQQTTDVAVIGLNGDAVVRAYFRARDVGIGPLHFADLPVSAGEINPPGFPEADAVVGMELLQRFNFVLDASSGHLTTWPRTHAAPMPAVSTSGVQGVYTSEELVVQHVMGNSPARQAGLQKGDRICAVNGERIDASWESGPKRAWSIGKPGTVIELTLCEGTRKSFVLSRFY